MLLLFKDLGVKYANNIQYTLISSWKFSGSTVSADIAFPPKTELVVTREGEKIIIQPLEKTMEDVPLLFAALKQCVIGEVVTRPEFIEAERNWNNKK